jgi:transcriptional antiterminator RfaH
MLLGLHNFETFMPLIRVRHAMVRYRTAQLFPSYLFVKIEDDFWYDVLWTPRVIRVIMSGDRPARMPVNAVELIQRKARGGYVTLPAKPTIRRGDTVRVLHGHFAGQLGLFDGQASHERQRILLDLLGSKVPVELPPGSVERLDVASATRFR